MTRIAILADIHANLLALEAVVEDIASQGVDEVLVGGDLVGRGPQGTEVTRRIAELGWPCIRGNHEDYVLNFWRNEVPEDWRTADEWSASRWMGAELQADAAAFLEQLPFSITSSLQPSLRLVHGTPQSYNEGLGKWSSPQQLQDALDGIEENLLVCGHTHRPFHCELPNGMIVNVGSVGMPFNGDWRAQYAILEYNSRQSWEVHFRQVEYSRDTFLEYYKTSGFLEDGGITSHLLHTELQTARPYLVPFLKWAEREARPPSFASLAPFLEIYDHTRPMALFFPPRIDSQ